MADVAIQWCDKGRNHAGPFFTIFAIALLSGPDSQRKGQKRVRCSKRVSRLCQSCLSKTSFTVKGADLLPVQGFDSGDGFPMLQSQETGS